MHTGHKAVHNSLELFNRVLPYASRQLTELTTAHSAGEKLQMQPCLGFHCYLDVPCHAFNVAVWIVRDSDHSAIAPQHPVPESCTAQEPADQVHKVSRQVAVPCSKVHSTSSNKHQEKQGDVQGEIMNASPGHNKVTEQHG